MHWASSMKAGSTMYHYLRECSPPPMIKVSNIHWLSPQDVKRKTSSSNRWRSGDVIVDLDIQPCHIAYVIKLLLEGGSRMIGGLDVALVAAWEVELR